MRLVSIAFALTACSSATPRPPQPAKVTLGAVSLGCFAYSPARRAAACVTGRLEPDGKGKLKVEFVGTSAWFALSDGPITPAAAEPIDAALGKDAYAPLTAGTVLAPGNVAHGVALEPEADGAANLVARCASGQMRLAHSDAELIARVTITVRRLDDATTLVELKLRKDGNELLGAQLLDLRTCRTIEAS